VQIYVSRYSNPTLKAGEVTPVCTSRGRPKWPLPYELEYEVEQLMPRGWMLALDKDRFVTEYEKHLEKVGVSQIREAIREVEDATGLPVCLLCYEDVRDPETYCHRSVFARWWTDKTGWPVTELQDPTRSPAPQPDGQGSLFE